MRKRDLQREANAKAAAETERRRRAAQLGISYESYVKRFC